MSIPEDLFEQLMNLPDSERIALGHQLLASAASEPEDRDPDWEESWAEEIRGREARLESGEARLLSEEEFMEELRQRQARRIGR